ncbi:cation/calcium exchanger 2-like [Andrographis paniculata]|uniref:cation/calcium exchanger 2-like n=1 Tax=Andrographis paniculata TaxID=175694 RepID=UPI0021E8C550|nr:cation/calcium exchanger 2-like [Andrographis paniculata]
MAKPSLKQMSKALLNLAFLGMIIISCLTTNPLPNSYHQRESQEEDIDCQKIHQNSRTKDQKCSYVRSHQGCNPRGYIPYLHFFYCTFTPYFLDYIFITLWLIILFYLLGDTASNYFCSSLIGLSKYFKLLPIISGVSLLSLGNGAPDIFASVISFTVNESVDIGLNSTLGAAVFVICVVFGLICLYVDPSCVIINKKIFITNVVFLLLSLACLVVIIIVGHVGMYGGISLIFLYFIYVIVVFTTSGEDYDDRHGDLSTPLLGHTRSDQGLNLSYYEIRENQENEKRTKTCTQEDRTLLIQFDHNDLRLEAAMLGQETGCTVLLHTPIWASQYNINDPIRVQDPNKEGRFLNFLDQTLCMLELPLDLPRRLTIPVVSPDKWSKPYGVAAATLAPLTLALIIFPTEEAKTRALAYAIGALIGIPSGILLSLNSDKKNPPRKWVVLWLVEGFTMSICWTYLLAQELVSLLVSLSLILGMSHSLIGLTVLAWGNSVGDLVANVAMSRNGGLDDVHVATSGCFAGPLFNVLVGLGLSLGISAWRAYPNDYEIICVGVSVYVISGFLVLGIIWTVVVLLKGNNNNNKWLGCGLIAIYACFLFVQILINLDNIEFNVPA